MPSSPMSRALYRLTGVPRPLEHRAVVSALERRAEAHRPAAHVRVIEPRTRVLHGALHGALPLTSPLWRQP